MGEIIKLEEDMLLPTQRNLSKDRMRALYRDFKDSELTKILIPIKEHLSGKYLIIDGHHSSCMYSVLKDFFEINLYGWVGENSNDLIPPKKGVYYPSNFRFSNQTLRRDFDFIEEDLEGAPNSILEMRKEYNWLKNPVIFLKNFSK